ncbi:methyltransferase family protein [Herbihabitans rhizosphaerae]|uniref:Methyltransferase family protein n=1 Tax=Herbihabitans rhizosphaerae TaxID=1872711 RepID=A0A4Q7KLC9_9PSEU|nr:glycosyltransferase [Herbihabitans rhizosphaerae]RZS37478.1 methyltransferase family protein [Herbihabitans rhizosphaerae]
MKHDDLLHPDVDYADGAEEVVLSTLRSASDVSAGSAELAGAITNWETAYHFSPARLGLLAPLRLREGMRAVDIGCGTGVLTRALGEAGLDVLGIEGVPDRAAAARERCRDLDGVTIRQGTPAALADAGEHDLAILCGVLEYSTLYGDGPLPLLCDTADALAEDGVLVLAIENQLGLPYLLGDNEDHHGAPWIGLADYPRGGQRTWTRRTLTKLLADAGLTAQRWLLPYPDYKLPRVIVDAEVFDRPDAGELVDKLVRDPSHGSFGGYEGVSPARVLQSMAVAEGAGVATAPSFLVLAARNDKAITSTVRDDLAWLISGSRRPEWRRTRALDRELTLHTVSAGTRGTGEWLRQRTVDTEPLIPGRGLDSLLLDALRAGDTAELERLIRGWRDTCAGSARRLSTEDTRHPFLPGKDDVPVLDPDCLDVHPGNVIVRPDGLPVRVDREWEAGTGVDAELALLRALLEFTRELAATRAPHPFGDNASVRDILRELCLLAGLGLALHERFDELIDAEAALQEIVGGQPASRTAMLLRAQCDEPAVEPLWAIPGGLDTLRVDHARSAELESVRTWAHGREAELLAELDRQRAHVDDLTAQVRKAGEQAEDAERRAAANGVQANENRLRAELAEIELDTARGDLARKDQALGDAFGELSRLVAEASAVWRAQAESEAELGRLRDLLARTRARLDALESSTLVRRAHRTVWPAARLLRGARDLALGRPGEEPDGVLRRVGDRSPALGRLLAGRVGRAARQSAARDAGLRYDVNVPPPVAVGAGQVVEFNGWVLHAELPVRAVHLAVGGRFHEAQLGYHRADVARELRAAGVRAPEGTGIHVRVPVTEAGELPVRLRVELLDGTVLERSLEPLQVRPALDVSTVDGRWPGTGTRVCVCLATHNPDPDFLALQVDSLRRQEHDNWVCVISDDASRPDALAAIHELVDGDERFTVVANIDNAGFYRNFERALALAPADAEALALCDQDDVWDADKLSTLVARLDDPRVSLVYADMRLIDSAGEVIADSFWDRRRNQWHDLPSLLMLNTITGAASLVRADLVRDRVLPFPPGTASSFHDQWIGACALAFGAVSYVDSSLHSYRQHDGAVTGRRDDRLDDGLPRGRGLVALSLGRQGKLPPEKHAELDAVAVNELRRVSQFASTLLLRGAASSAPRWASDLTDLAAADHDMVALVRAVARSARTSAVDTAGADHRLLTAGLRWHALRRTRRRIPPLPPAPLS